MQLSIEEATPIDAFWKLQPDAAVELSALAQRLAALSGTAKVDWSDEWSDEDLRDYTTHAVERLESDE
jgi:hypothetical protein